MQYQGRAVVLLIFFVLISGSRDVFAEFLMKSGEGLSPATIVVAFGVSAFFVAIVDFAFSRSSPKPLTSPELTRAVITRIVLLNITTAIAYGATIYAIWSNLGAAYTNMIDYSLTPLFASLIAWRCMGERIKKANWFCILFAIAGLFILGLSSEIDSAFPNKLKGLFAIVVASIFGAWMYAINKSLVSASIPTYLILGTRMILTIVFGIAFLLRNGQFDQLKVLPEIVPFTVIFHGIPMFLVLIVFKRIKFSDFSVWLFLIPIITFTLSIAVESVHLSLLNLIGAFLVFVPFVLFQIAGKKSENSEGEVTS